MIKVSNILIKVSKKLTNDELLNLGIKKLVKKYHLKENDIKSKKIIKKSIDARYDVCYSLIIGIELEKHKEEKLLKIYKEFSIYEEKIIELKKTNKPLNILVVGAGPSGLFNALTLAECGHFVTLIEQGEPVEERVNTINNFWNDGILKPYSNVQFGEGGAGTFSDGKLNTGVNTIYNQYVLEKFVYFGANKDILIDTKPHVGTDVLRTCLKNLRNYLISLNTKIYFNQQFINYNIVDNKVNVVIKDLKSDELINKVFDKVVLGIGHSAKATYQMLKEKIVLEPKPFALGVRVEHLQEVINESLHKDAKAYLPAASYKLVKHLKNGRTVYSFCMCPGGEVVNASSEEGKLVVNGMSYSKRDSIYANSAILVNINVEDYYKNSPLDGLYFQEHYEELAYKLLDGKVPVQKFNDFKNNIVTKELDKKPSIKSSYGFANLHDCLPEFVCESLIEGIDLFENNIKGFSDNPLLLGIESRSSSPIRIKRNDNFESSDNLIYPIGEGAGYSGGIMTSAIDGIKCAIVINNSTLERGI